MPDEHAFIITIEADGEVTKAKDVERPDENPTEPEEAEE